MRQVREKINPESLKTSYIFVLCTFVGWWVCGDIQIHACLGVYEIWWKKKHKQKRIAYKLTVIFLLFFHFIFATLSKMKQSQMKKEFLINYKCYMKLISNSCHINNNSTRCFKQIVFNNLNSKSWIWLASMFKKSVWKVTLLQITSQILATKLTFVTLLLTLTDMYANHKSCFPAGQDHCSTFLWKTKIKITFKNLLTNNQILCIHLCFFTYKYKSAYNMLTVEMCGI